MSGGMATPALGVGVTEEWYTPPAIFEALGLSFDLDPAHPVERLPWVPAAQTYCVYDDGLSLPWHGRVWLNPPYGTIVDRWLERFVEHGHGIALVFARTDTEWFHRRALAVDAWCFLRGRLKFIDAEGEPASDNAGAPSMLLAAGEDCVAALRQSGLGITTTVNESVSPGQASIWSLP